MLLDAVLTASSAAGLTGGTYIEVEQAAADEPAVRALQTRRLAFYARHGAVVLDVPYALPDLGHGHGHGPPAHLMWAGPGGRPPGPTGQAAAARDIGRVVYGAPTGRGLAG